MLPGKQQLQLRAAGQHSGNGFHQRLPSGRICGGSGTSHAPAPGYLHVGRPLSMPPFVGGVCIQFPKRNLQHLGECCTRAASSANLACPLRWHDDRCCRQQLWWPQVPVRALVQRCHHFHAASPKTFVSSAIFSLRALHRSLSRNDHGKRRDKSRLAFLGRS